MSGSGGHFAKRSFSWFVFQKPPVVPLHDPDHGGPAQCSRTTRSVVHPRTMDRWTSGSVTRHRRAHTQHTARGVRGRRGARARARSVGLWVHTPTRTCGVGRPVWEYVKFGP